MHDRLLVITQGAARVVRGPAARAGNEFAGPLGRGDTVGEISYIDGFGAISTLIAESDVDVLRIEFCHIDAMIDGDPAFGRRFYRALLAAMSGRLRYAHRRNLLPFA